MEAGDVRAGRLARGAHVTILSNGHGEDAMGARLGEELAARGLSVTALPIVGEGAAYRSAGIEPARRGKVLPSGGFAWRSSARDVLRDFRAGSWSEWRGQRAALRNEAERADLLIGVGDSVLVGMVALLGKHPPFFFLPTAQSVHNSRFYGFERRLMRRHCRAIYPRDRETAAYLRGVGLPAHFVGNLMMDLLRPSGAWPPHGLKSRPGVHRVALLPGSRDEAYDNLGHLLRVVEVMEAERPGGTDFAVALSGGLRDDRLEEVIREAGWQVRDAYWEGPPVATGRAEGARVAAPAAPGTPRLYPVRGAFPDVLRWSEVVLGMAGTASEQAVGLGRPVVSFAGTGPQFTPRFAEGQRRLLGESLSLVPRGDDDPGPVASPQRVTRELLAILSDEERRERMAAVGRARMGELGGAAQVAEGALRVLAPKPPLISVVIPTYNRRALLEQVLDGLSDQALGRGGPSHPFEAVVADDGSTDGTPARCESARDRYPFPLRLIACPHRGRAHTRNAGIRAARGEFVILLDSDVVVGPEFVAAHALAHKLYEGWPVPSPMIAHGPVMHVADPVAARRRDLGSEVKDLSRAFFATANVSVARTHLFAAGLFDEDFREYGWEDLELGMRLKRLGLRKVKAPSAVGYHYAEPLELASLPEGLAKERARGHSAVLYNQKNDHWEVRNSTLALPLAFWFDRVVNVRGWADRPDVVERLQALEGRGRGRAARFLAKRLLFHAYMNGMREAEASGSASRPAPDGPDGRLHP